MHEILLVNPREMGLCLRQPGVQDSEGLLYYRNKALCVLSVHKKFRASENLILNYKMFG